MGFDPLRLPLSSWAQGICQSVDEDDHCDVDGVLLGEVESFHLVGYPVTLSGRIETLIGARDELDEKFRELIVFLSITDRFLHHEKGTLASEGLASLTTPKSVSYVS